MENLAVKIKEDMIQALKSKKTAELSTLRMLLAKLENEKVQLKLSDITQLTKQQVELVVGKNIKELDKEIASYVEVGREVVSQENEKKLLLSYLPKQMSEDEIRKEVAHSVGLVERGEIRNPMQYLSQKLRGKADMSLVTKIAKEYQK